MPIEWLRHPTRFKFRLICLFLIGVGSIAMCGTWAKDRMTLPAMDIFTPSGIKIITNGYEINPELFDLKKKMVLECMRIKENNIDFIVEIVTDEEAFECKSDKGLCWGEEYPKRHVRLTADGHSFAHEFVHVLNQNRIHNKETRRCGHDIDDKFSLGGWHTYRSYRPQSPE